MKAALLVESLTGNTWKAAEMIAGNLQQEGWSITGLSPLRQPDHGALQAAGMVIIGTWVHGAFIIGQAPWGIGAINALPSIGGKKAATFCTFALNPGKTLDVMTRTLQTRGAEVVGGLALNRAKLDEHTETFVDRLLSAVGA